MAYSEKVIDHYQNPKNVGTLDKSKSNVGTGLVGAPECGDVMRLQIEVDDATGMITDAKFKTFGCGSAIASSSLATEWLKGKSIDEAHLHSMRAERIQELAKPEANQKGWLVVGYLFALLGGFFGIIIGYVLYTSQKTLPNGQMVYTYNASDRKQGKNILVLSIIILVVCIALIFLSKEK